MLGAIFETKWVKMDSSKGEKGDPGYTPQKGVDYFTAEDKEELKQEILSKLDVKKSVVETLNTLNIVDIPTDENGDVYVDENGNTFIL